MKKLNKKQKRNLLLVFAFIALGSVMLSVGVKHSDEIQTKWDEITEKFEKDDAEENNDDASSDVETENQEEQE